MNRFFFRRVTPLIRAQPDEAVFKDTSPYLFLCGNERVPLLIVMSSSKFTVALLKYFFLGGIYTVHTSKHHLFAAFYNSYSLSVLLSAYEKKIPMQNHCIVYLTCLIFKSLLDHYKHKLRRLYNNMHLQKKKTGNAM